MIEVSSKKIAVLLFKRTFPNYRFLGKNEIFIPDKEVFNAKLVNSSEVKHATGNGELVSGIITDIDNLTDFSYMSKGDEIKLKRESDDNYSVMSFGASFRILIHDLLTMENTGEDFA